MTPRLVRALAGIYDADAGLLGELRYLAGRLRGQHCTLCDITHTLRGERPAFAPVRARLKLDTYHLNEQPPALAAATRGRTPCVAAQTSTGWQVLVTREALAECAGDIEAFERTIIDALSAAGLTLSDDACADPTAAG